MPSSEVDVPPRPIGSRAAPRSPRGLAMAGVTGDVLVAFAVEPSGRVDACSIRIVTTPRREYSATAKAYVARLHYAPALKGGIPVRVQIQDTVRFRETLGDRGRHHLF